MVVCSVVHRCTHILTVNNIVLLRRCFIFFLLIMIALALVAENISFNNKYPLNVTIAEGKIARFSCELFKNHEPTDTVVWVKHRMIIDKDISHSRYSYATIRISPAIYEFILKIDPVERSDETYYMCVYSVNDTYTLSSKKAYLDVLQVPSTLYPVCSLSQSSYHISDQVQATCLSEKTIPPPSMQFVSTTELASSGDNATHIWITIQFAAVPNMNDTAFSCRMYIDVIKKRKYCSTDSVIVENKLRVVIHGYTLYYTPSQTASFTCSGNYTDSGNFIWTRTNQNDTYTNRLTIPSVSADMHGTKITCTVYDADFTGSDTIVLVVEDQSTGTERTINPTAISTHPTISPALPNMISDVLELPVIEEFIGVYFLLIILLSIAFMSWSYFAYRIYALVRV